jgi:hypothetical protein
MSVSDMESMASEKTSGAHSESLDGTEANDDGGIKDFVGSQTHYIFGHISSAPIKGFVAIRGRPSSVPASLGLALVSDSLPIINYLFR